MTAATLPPRSADDTPLARYRALLASGALRPDPSQQAAAERLDALAHALQGHRLEPEPIGWRARLGLARRRPDAAPRGLYIHGDVGRGKSMLMDIFFEAAPLDRKRRVHFNAFMVEVHKRIHAWRRASLEGRGVAEDPIPALAAAVADEAWLLCFDEFHVVDIADAMILGRLFTRLFEMGVVVVATSNWAPDDLYKDGLQRDRFLPFIALVKERMAVIDLIGGIDYRLDRIRGMPVYHHPLGPVTRERLAAAFADLTGDTPAMPETLSVQGRALTVPKSARGVAWVDFHDLCAEARASADYLALARRYHTVILDGVPRLTADQRNEAKRFILLIDALYEHKVKLIVAADTDPAGIYAHGHHAFEFHRTVSRLMEMQAADYLQRAHLA